jgi:hypothetical protein
MKSGTRRTSVAAVAAVFLAVVALAVFAAVGLADQAAVGLSLPLWGYDTPQIKRYSESLMLDRRVGVVVVWANDPERLLHVLARDAQWQVKAVIELPAASGLIPEEREIAVLGQAIGRVTVFATTRFLEDELAAAGAQPLVEAGAVRRGGERRRRGGTGGGRAAIHRRVRVFAQFPRRHGASAGQPLRRAPAGNPQGP